MSYCTAHEISPTEVDATTFSQFREAYENASLLRDPGAMYRDTCVLWNRAVASIPGWPTLSVEVPVRRRDFALPVDHFPAAFGEDIVRFLSQGTDPDVFSETYAKPIRPLTARGRRQHILMAATALVQSGLPPASITGLEVLVRIENAKSALRFLRGRAGGKSTGYIHHIATLLKTIARHYVRVDPKTVEEFRRLCSNLQPEKHGMTDKNKKCLRQFADEKKLRALILLPQRLMADAASGSGNHRRDGVQATLGLAIAIELAIPIRAQNLVGLRLDRHIHRQGSKVFLAIPAEETKNNEPIEAELPPKLTRLLDAYLEEFRPRLFAGASPWLFPGEQGRCRTPGGFAAQVSAVIAKMAGITITLHQFRHFAAKLYLDHQLGDYETVRKLLAHKSILTTQQFYWELDAMLARRRYADLLSDMVGELTRTPKAKPGHNRGRRGDV